MHYYKAEVQYDGTNYAGFQWQPDIPTIQNELNLAFEKLTTKKISTLGASRTDTGVHAFSQMVKITSELKIKQQNTLDSINALLPFDIKILNFSEIDGLYNPITSSQTKEYFYLFTNLPMTINESEQRFIANFGKKLNLEIINEALTFYLGEHNFQNFYSTGSNVSNTIRTIGQIELVIVNPHEIFKNSLFSAPESLDKCFQLKICANGFLKQMIRHIVSSLWMVGTEKMSLSELKKIIEKEKSSKQLWKVAPPNGLFLSKIN